MQAKDIPDRLILGVIEALNRPMWHQWLSDDPSALTTNWASKADIYDLLGAPPAKVMHAKLRAIKRRKLATGCTGFWCGCTGWELTAAGREYITTEEITP